MDTNAERLVRETALEAARKARDDAREAYEALVEDLALSLDLEANECRFDIDEFKAFSEEIAGTKRDMRFLRQRVKRGAVVGSRTRILASRRPRASHARRPGHRRTTRARAGSSDDSDSDGPGEAGPPACRRVVVDDHFVVTSIEVVA